jgi:serine/threonine protein kinase
LHETSPSLNIKSYDCEEDAISSTIAADLDGDGVMEVIGNAKISDFGLARILGLDPATAPPFFIGASSPSYLAPELLVRGAAGDPESDVYALGIVLYEALAGTVPGRRSPLPSVARPDVPRELDPIFERMTADRRDERYAHAGALLDELFAALPSLGNRSDLVLSVRPSPPPTAGERLRAIAGGAPG